MWVSRTLAATAALTATLGLAAACGGDDSEKNGVVTLQFQSLAYQKPTVAAVARVVQSWNASHPKIHVKLRQGSWDSVHDQLTTQFAGGTAPDIVHDEAADIEGFAQAGFLADISPHLSPAVKRSVPQGVWNTVSEDGKTYAVPTLLQSYVVIANTDLLKKDGISVPTGKQLSWDDLRSMARKATVDGRHGLGWGLKEPTSTVLSLSLNFDGKFFSGKDLSAKVVVGHDEKQVPRRIHQMAYDDKSIDQTSLTQSGTDILPGFYAGKYAMIVAGNYVAQQITEQAPKSFHWAVLPPLAGSSTDQAADPQTLSVAAASKHVPQATQFLNYFMSARNLAAIGQGDWLIPTTGSARAAIASATGGRSGWGPTLAAADAQTEAAYQPVTNYPRWKDEIATPALQLYLANKISLSELADRLSDGWKQVNQ